MTNEQSQMLTRIDERVNALLLISVDVEKRVRRLEQFRNWAAGVAAIIGTALGFTLKPIH